ncbi:glycerophosphodiester phosphodiesterase [Terribacillus saccharophilus]|uniref:Glycerophosphodiester phosphodiesterase n=2 Tax=Terribacillus saccharophilus TaxID=361277 RepID=A0ABX4GTF1_9BACI|nr:glycerophosphodiester phosphodiesterase family protein [Terribacillus saccharophilus]PAD94389.1 glycerophosphodiester phosphodiesterase [Terribacillus saccharophilus]PAD98137.1 glycerophosphodiester phosphodiesterase [Terribacillus saccharophilus]
MKKLMNIVILSCLLLVSGCSFVGSADGGAPTEKETAYDPLIIAHRGASDLEPEHTFLSYERALEDGADYIEIDLRQTKDGELVAVHDEDVDRITDGSGKVEDLTLDEIKQLNVDKGQKILTLQEIVDKYKDTAHYYIETRTDSKENIVMEEQLVSILESQDLIEKDRVIIQSFYEDSMLKIHELNSEIPFVRLLRKAEVQELDDETLQHIKKYAMAVGIYAGSVDAELLKQIHDNGLQLHVYYYDDEKELAPKMLDMKVDGFFTNDPAYAIDLVKEANKKEGQ